MNIYWTGWRRTWRFQRDIPKVMPGFFHVGPLLITWDGWP